MAVSLSEEMRQETGDKEGFFAGGGYIGRSTPHRLLVSVLAERALRGEREDEEFKSYGRDLASPRSISRSSPRRARSLRQWQAPRGDMTSLRSLPG
jgi:hypothetical protein